MEKEKAEQILQQLNLKNIIDMYEDELINNNIHIKTDNMQKVLSNKKLFLKDSDLSFSKHIEYAYGNEMKQYEMFIGKCQRKTFLEWNNTYKQDSEYLKILQLNETMKNTFIKFLESKQLIKDKNVEYILESEKFQITGIIDAIYLKNNNLCMLHFESIKNNYFVKGNEDFQGNPMQRHLIKVFPAMIKTGLPMTLIYQDRGTLELNKYELHLDDKFNLYINNIIYSEFNLGEIIQNINLMYEEIIVNGKAPARSYKVYKKEDLFILSKNKLINKKESDEIFAGLKVYPFDCNKCVFKNICDNLPEQSFK